MLKVYDDTKIYVCCPPFAQTGGPESLHTLAYQLRNSGYDACICYYGASGNPVASEYRAFNLPYVFEPDENPHNIIIVPEIWGHLLQNYPKMQRVFYWLSVDNYFGHPKVDFSDNDITHFVQSYYAQNFLHKNNVKNVEYISDYIKDFYIQNAPEAFLNRQNIVLYNPAKGFDVTRSIISQANNIKFEPISGLNQQSILDLCLTSKIYIDFGNHPGKDKIPRETAVLGNIVITNRKGSAGFYGDVSIKDEYKFENAEQNITQIVNKIEYCLENYDECIWDFKEYRNNIMHEKARLICDIKRIFVKV